MTLFSAFTPLEKKPLTKSEVFILVAVGGLKPPTSDTFLTGFTIIYNKSAQLSRFKPKHPGYRENARKILIHRRVKKMERLRGLVDAGQIDRQVLEETGSTKDTVAWLKRHGGISTKQQYACEKGNPSCGCKDHDEQVVEKISIYGPDLPLFYS